MENGLREDPGCHCGRTLRLGWQSAVDSTSSMNEKALDRSQHVEQIPIPTGHVGPSVHRGRQRNLGKHTAQGWTEANTDLSQRVGGSGRQSQPLNS